MREDRDSPSEVLARQLIRNVLAGTVAMYGVSFAICLPSLSASTSAGVAVLPAVFAGPFVGGLVTMVMATRRAEAIEAAETSAAHDVVPVGPDAQAATSKA